MKTKIATTIVTLLSAVALNAELIGIDTSFVGDAGNANSSAGYGAVDYNYYIGTYAVTNAQYAEFLNAVASESDTYNLYNTGMAKVSGMVSGGIVRTYDEETGTYSYSTIVNGEDRGNWAVNYVSFWDAARFCNWVTTGDTERGVYMLNGVVSPTNSSIVRDTAAWEAGGVAISSQDEWYKAAFYNASTSTYYAYTNMQNNNALIKIGDIANTYWTGLNHVTDADFGSEGPYDTYGQGGNVWEWNDTIINTTNRIRRGGNFFAEDRELSSTGNYNRETSYATFEDYGTGFRVSSLTPIIAIPEPSTYALIFGVLALGLVLYRRR